MSEKNKLILFMAIFHFPKMDLVASIGTTIVLVFISKYHLIRKTGSPTHVIISPEQWLDTGQKVETSVSLFS